jgi:hypothetical protein
MLLQVLDLIELAGLLPLGAEQGRAWRINGLARLRAAFAQSCPQQRWKARFALSNHGLSGFL